VRLPAQADGVTDLGGQRAARPARCTQVRVRDPAARKAARQRFVSGKARAKPPRTLFLTDPAGRLLLCAQTRPGAIHQLTQVCPAGRVELAASRASPCRLTPTIRGSSVQIAGPGRGRSLSRRRADQLRRPTVVMRIRRRSMIFVRCE
jgi:hypothetical protein